jgi:5-formyltetrahydrofolate cyclo-ligase
MTTNTIRNIQLEKTALRQKMRKLRSRLSASYINRTSQQISDTLLQLEMITTAQTIFCYLSFKQEVSTFYLIKHLLQRQKTVLVPKMIKGEMLPIDITSLEQVTANSYGILEPIESKPFTLPIDICIVPGLAFTQDGKRLGFGGSYYDRYFAQNKTMLKIALAYSFQIIAQLPTEPHDQIVDLIITENEIIDCRDKTVNPLYT